MPVTMMNLQMNSLTHQLYGAGCKIGAVAPVTLSDQSFLAGADLTDQYKYYQLCCGLGATRQASLSWEAYGTGFKMRYCQQLDPNSWGSHHSSDFRWSAAQTA